MLGTSETHTLVLCVCVRERACDLNPTSELFSHVPQNLVRVSCSEHDQISEVRVSAVTYIDAVHVANRTIRIEQSHRGIN